MAYSDFHAISNSVYDPINNSIRTSLGGEVTTVSTITSVASSVTSVPLSAANAQRKSITVFNESTAILYIALSAGAASLTSYTVQVAPNGYYEVPGHWRGAVNGLWSAANGKALVTELT